MKVSGAKVLVTGGAGFVPSHVVDALVGAGADVTVLDNFTTGRRSNLDLSMEDIRVVEMDIRDEDVGSIVKAHDVVVHMAANADVPLSVSEPEMDFDCNVIGSYNILRACRESDVQKLVFASSAAVYGQPIRTPIDESHPTSPRSPYGAAKLAVEKLGLAYHECFGLPIVVVRIFNTYGTRQPRYVMYDLLRKLYRDPTKLEVLGTGAQIRDYSYVTDTARCFLLAAQTDLAGDVFNVAGGHPTSIAELVTQLIAAVGLSDVEVTFTGKSWPGDIETLVADISKAERLLGFVPKVPLGDGVRLLETWLRAADMDA